VSADRPDRVEQLHARLREAVEGLTTSGEWRQMLRVAAAFPTYSPNNVLLIAAQRPDATRIAGYRAWARLGRQVRAGEHGIAILAPVLRRADSSTSDAPNNPTLARPPRALAGFRVTHVFDISQTDGPALPDVRPAVLRGMAPLRLWAGLLEQVTAAGYRFGYADLAPANGRTDFGNRTVLVRSGLPGAQQAKTLAHEYAHVLLHAPGARPDGLARDRAEVEAESVAYVVAAAHGLAADKYTVPYVAGWARDDTDALAATATRVLGCARTILREIPPPAGTAPTYDAARVATRQGPEPLVPERSQDQGRAR
jgi:hypothetical protein